MKQSSKPYGIEKPHIRVSDPPWKMSFYPFLTIRYKRFSALERKPQGHFFYHGNGETIGEAWADLMNEKAKYYEWVARNAWLKAQYELPTITVVSK